MTLVFWRAVGERAMGMRIFYLIGVVVSACLVQAAIQDDGGGVPLTAAGKPSEEGIDPFLGEPQFESRQLFEGERFPNVAVTASGTVLATWGSRSFRVRRSEDGGKTWGPEITVADPGFHGGGAVVDEKTGDILVFVEDGHPPAALTLYRSRDDGKSWEAQEVVIHPDIHGNVPSMHMNERGITLRHGPQAGRLLRPARWYAGGNQSSEWPNHYTNAIYSDDGGQTWQTSAPFPARGTGEAAPAELANGRIYYNSRRHWAPEGENPRMRWIAWSDDSGETWENLSVSDELPDGDQNRDYGLMAGLVRLPVAGRDILIFSNIESPAGRRGGTVWASFDGGQSWPVKRLVEKGGFAYSSLAAGRPGTPSEGWIYLMFESGGHPNSTAQMARFNLSWMLEGQEVKDLLRGNECN
jgi:sialidase-1